MKVKAFNLLMFVWSVTIPVFAQTKAERLEQLFNHLDQKGMYNGSVAVRDQGTLIFREAYGVGSFERGTPFLPEHQTEIASVSKQFTATAIMLLHQEGQLDLHEDIQRYFKAEWPYTGMTLHHLLTHTAGLPSYERYFRANWHSDELVYNADIMNFIYREQPALHFPPGEKHEYSNLGYVLLAEIVEKVSGQRLDVFLQERIFGPYGMKHTGFYDRAAIFDMENYAPGMIWDASVCAYVRPESLPAYRSAGYLSGRYGPGRLTSTVDDLLIWDQVLYDSTLLSEESRALMFHPHVIIPDRVPRMHYGYGFRIPPVDTLGQEVEHSGAWMGNYTHIKRYPEAASVYVLLNNTYSPYMDDIRAAIDAILKNRPFDLPRPFLHDYMQKHLCAAGFDQEAWLETHADLTHYRINRNAWAQYLKRMRETADQGTIQFLEAVDARIPRN